MKQLTLLIAVLAALFLSACRTMQGLGQDVQKAGSSIETTAVRASH